MRRPQIYAIMLLHSNSKDFGQEMRPSLFHPAHLYVIWCFFSFSALGVRVNSLSGSFAYIKNNVEKQFIDLSGQVHNILKGGVVTSTDNGMCHITVKETKNTYTEFVTYGVDCSRLIPTDLQCPSISDQEHTCKQVDYTCISDSLYYNGFVVIQGPISG